MMSKDLMYCRAILKKVSFNADLFKKELKKSYRWLNSKDKAALKKWVKAYIAQKSNLQDRSFSDIDPPILG